MKKLLIILLFILISLEVTPAKKPRFFLTYKVICDSSLILSANNKMYLLEDIVAKKIQEVYSCAEINTFNSVSQRLDDLRKIWLLNDIPNDELQESISNIAKDMSCDYLVSLKMQVFKDNTLIKITIMDSKNAMPLSIATTSLSLNSIDNNSCENISKQLIDGLKTFEICPFTGPITINIISTLKDNKKEEYPVYCNESDGMYRKTIDIDNYSENNWTIEKTDKHAAKGNVNFNLSEEMKIEEQNSCYECSPNKQGPRTYSAKTTTYSTLQGLSNESESYGIKVDDARAEITFLDNGTYTIRVKAASTQGEKKTKKEVHAEGVCNNISNNPETITNKIDEGVNEIFGPFTGNAQDKILSQKDTIKRTDPNTNEESTITYEFNLTRE